MSVTIDYKLYYHYYPQPLDLLSLQQKGDGYIRDVQQVTIFRTHPVSYGGLLCGGTF